MRFFSGKALIYWESSLSLVRLHPPISFAPVGGMRHFVAQITSMDAILMGYWVVDQERTMRISVMHKSKLRMGGITLRRVLIIPCEMFLREHFMSTRIIALLGSGRGIIDDHGDSL